MNKTHQLPDSWHSEKVRSFPHPEKGGHAVYAQEPIRKGERVAVFGGTIVTGETLATLSARYQSLSIQVEEDLYLVSFNFGPADNFNHCCDPNVGLEGQITLVAMRDIEAGEEVCFDYAMSDGSPYDEFDCQCGATTCRGHVTGDDWQIPELWARYAGYFSPYLQRRINKLKEELTERARQNGGHT